MQNKTSRNIDKTPFEFDETQGFFKLKEAFGWSETASRAKAWRACLDQKPNDLYAACKELKSLDFRGPTGLSLLGLVLVLEPGGDDLDAPLLRGILRAGASPDYPIDEAGHLALSRCCVSGRVDAALLLLDKGASLSAREPGEPSVFELAQVGHSVAKQLIALASHGG